MNENSVARRAVLCGLSAGLLGAALLAPPSRLAAAGTAPPVAFLQDLGDRAVAMLSNPDLSEAERAERFRELMRQSFDMNAIARFILGRYWRSASDGQHADFIDVFEQVMSARFAPFFSGSSEQSFDIIGLVDGAGKPDRPIVRSKIRLDDGKLAQVDWRMNEQDGQFRIVDVVTEGVSMGITLRSEYGSVLSRNNGDMDALIDALRRKVKNQTA